MSGPRGPARGGVCDGGRERGARRGGASGRGCGRGRRRGRRPCREPSGALWGRGPGAAAAAVAAGERWQRPREPRQCLQPQPAGAGCGRCWRRRSGCVSDAGAGAAGGLPGPAPVPRGGRGPCAPGAELGRGRGLCVPGPGEPRGWEAPSLPASPSPRVREEGRAPHLARSWGAAGAAGGRARGVARLPRVAPARLGFCRGPGVHPLWEVAERCRVFLCRPFVGLFPRFRWRIVLFYLGSSISNALQSIF